MLSSSIDCVSAPIVSRWPARLFWAASSDRSRRRERTAQVDRPIGKRTFIASWCWQRRAHGGRRAGYSPWPISGR